MTRALSELVELLSPERIAENRYSGRSKDFGFGPVFGGQLLGQALYAAAATVGSERQVHSLHAYFLQSADAIKPILYQVEPLRDGGSFSTRRVLATQDERPVFSLSASCQLEAEGLEHADVMPEVAGPETLRSDLEILKRNAHLLSPASQKLMAGEHPIDLRSIEQINPFAPEKRPPDNFLWMRATGPLPDDPALHRRLLAYCSDFGLAMTSLRPHGVSAFDPRMQLTSLDHVMWFHRPFRMDEWLLHVMHSPSACAARCLTRGSLFAQDGRLIASTCQEGFLRDRKQGQGHESTRGRGNLSEK